MIIGIYYYAMRKVGGTFVGLVSQVKLVQIPDEGSGFFPIGNCAGRQTFSILPVPSAIFSENLGILVLATQHSSYKCAPYSNIKYHNLF